MATSIMGKKPTGERKPWVPTIVKWPINLGRASWLLLVAGVGILAGLRVAAGDPLGAHLLAEPGVLAAAGLATLLALGGVVGGIIHPLSRMKAIVNSAIGLALAAGIFGLFGWNVQSARAQLASEAASNDRARQIAQDGLIASRLLAQEERGPRYARALRAAEAVATGAQREQLTTIAVGIEAINEASAAQRKGVEALKAAGGIGIEGLTDKAAIAARRKLIADERAGTVELHAVLSRVQKEWNTKLVPPVATDRDRELLLQSFILKQLEEMKKLQELEQARDEALAALDASFGRWTVKKGALVFRNKADGEAWKTALAKAQSLETAIAPLPGATPAPGAPKQETITPEDAKPYAVSYVTLLQRGHFEEAYKYLPPDVSARVPAERHQTHWTNAAGTKLEELRVETQVELDGGMIGFRVAIPGKEPEIVVVMKQSGKFYAMPAVFVSG
jgi:hypothetical protein